MHQFNAYVDYSMVPDSDPLAPLTPIGRVPNFLARLHAILCRKDLSDIICWLPHGRSWRILKPSDFEQIIMPKYFGHCKLSSFLRQAASWGFRRISIGMSVDSYVHPLFLRGIPHLSKLMKRFSTEKARGFRLALKDLDLDQISNLYPVPETYVDDSVLLPSILQHGPKARVPVFSQWRPKISDFEFVDDDPNGRNPLWLGSSSHNSSSGSSYSFVLPAVINNQTYNCDVSRATVTNKKSKKPAESYVNESASNSLLDTLADVSATKSRKYVPRNSHDIVSQNLSMLPIDNTGNLTNRLSCIRDFASRPYELSSTELHTPTPIPGIDRDRALRNPIPAKHVEPCLGNTRIGFHPQSTESFRNRIPTTMSKGVDTENLGIKQYLSDTKALSLFTAGFAAAQAMNAKKSLHMIQQSNDVFLAYEQMFTNH